MKKLLILLMLSVSVLSYAQEYKREGNTFIVVKSTKNKSSSKETKFTIKDTDGKTYKVYISKNGKTYINKISKKSGKIYRKYIPLEDKI